MLAGKIRLSPSLQTWLPRSPTSGRGRRKPQYCSQVVPMEAEAGTLISGFHLRVSDGETEAHTQKDHKH